MKIKKWCVISVRSVLATGLTIGLAAGLASVIISWPAFVLNAIPHVRFPLLYQILSGMVAGLALGLLLGLKHDLPGGLGSPQGLATSRRKDRVPGLVAAVTIGLMIGLAAGFGFGLAAGLAVMVWFRLTPRLAGGFVAVLAAGSAHGESSPQGPLESWRNDRVFGLLTGLGLDLGLGFGSGAAILIGFKIGFGTGLVVVVADAISCALVGLIYGAVSSTRWPTTARLAPATAFPSGSRRRSHGLPRRRPAPGGSAHRRSRVPVPARNPARPTGRAGHRESLDLHGDDNPVVDQEHLRRRVGFLPVLP